MSGDLRWFAEARDLFKGPTLFQPEGPNSHLYVGAVGDRAYSSSTGGSLLVGSGPGKNAGQTVIPFMAGVFKQRTHAFFMGSSATDKWDKRGGASIGAGVFAGVSHNENVMLRPGSRPPAKCRLDGADKQQAAGKGIRFGRLAGWKRRYWSTQILLEEAN